MFSRLIERLGAGVDGDYECRTCGAGYRVQYHVCPDCEGFSVDPVSTRGVRN